MILAGNGCVRKRTSKELRTFCDSTGIGVVNTFMGKGCVDMDADYALFTVGLGAKDIVNCAIDEADLVISIGFDMVEYHPRTWNNEKNKTIIHIDFVPTEIDEYYHPETEIIGDIAGALEKLNDLAKNDSFDFNFDRQKTIRKAMQDELAKHKDDDTKGNIRPQKVLWDTREVMGKKDIVLSDVGAHKMWIARHYQCHEPNTCLIPNGFCSMGFALPGAIAASLVYPDRKILAICGDGGFLMNVQEMETAKRLNSNIVVMVWVDQAYGLIAWKQENEFKRHTPLSFENPDFVQLAKSFGWHGHYVENAKDFKGTLENAFAEKGPSLVALSIDYNENKVLSKQLSELTCPI